MVRAKQNKYNICSVYYFNLFEKIIILIIINPNNSNYYFCKNVLTFIFISPKLFSYITFLNEFYYQLQTMNTI